MRALRLDVVLTLVLHLDLLVTKGASQGHWQAASAAGGALLPLQCTRDVASMPVLHLTLLVIKWRQPGPLAGCLCSSSCTCSEEDTGYQVRLWFSCCPCVRLSAPGQG